MDTNDGTKSNSPVKEMDMPKRKKQARKPAPMRWEFDPDIPTHDFFEGGSLDDMWNLQEAVDSFVHWLEEDRFLTWEAVVCGGRERLWRRRAAGAPSVAEDRILRAAGLVT